MTIILIVVVVLAAGYLAYRRFGLPGAAPAATSPEPSAQAEAAAPVGEHEQRLGELRDNLRDAYQPQQLARFTTTASTEGDSTREAVFTLYETSIQTPGGKHDLTAQTKATVGTHAEIVEEGRAALERTGQGTVITGPVGTLLKSTADGEADDRLRYLLLEGDRWVDSESCPRGQSDVATAFAEDVNRAAADCERVQEKRAGRIEELSGQVETATREHANRPAA